MRIGFFTSTFGDRPFEEVLDFAKASGFDAIEIDGNSHIGSAEKVAPVVAAARERGLFVAAIACVGNQLDPDRKARTELHVATGDFARAAGESKVPILVIFPGNDAGAAEADNYRDFADYTNDLLAATAGSGLSIAIENWPGPQNSFIATTPCGWAELLALIPDRRFGLEYDPSHLIRLGIDPYEAFEAVKERVIILHAKDTSIDRMRLQDVGYHGTGWWRYRLPGDGSLDWQRFLRMAMAYGLRRNHFD